MPVAVVRLDIHLPYAESLKDRRQVVRRLKDRLRQHFNVSVAELDEGETLWQRAQVGIAAIGGDVAYLRGQMSRATAAALDILRGQEVQAGDIEILE